MALLVMGPSLSACLQVTWLGMGGGSACVECMLVDVKGQNSLVGRVGMGLSSLRVVQWSGHGRHGHRVHRALSGVRASRG